MPELRLLELSSSLVEMGRHYMVAFPHEIQEFTADRLQLSRNKNLTGHKSACHQCFIPITITSALKLPVLT